MRGIVGLAVVGAVLAAVSFAWLQRYPFPEAAKASRKGRAPPPPRQPVPVCDDDLSGTQQCRDWANAGECDINPSNLELNCAHACEVLTVWSSSTVRVTARGRVRHMQEMVNATHPGKSALTSVLCREDASGCAVGERCPCDLIVRPEDDVGMPGLT